MHEHRIRTDPGYAKLQVLKRDDCRCELCGVDTFAAHRAEESDPSRRRRAVAMKLETFDMDHRVPVVEGGGSCGLDNLRTLCRPCHKRVTAELAARRAAARREGNRFP